MANKSLVINAEGATLEQKVVGLMMCLAQEKRIEIERLLEGKVGSLLQLNLLHTLAAGPEEGVTVGQLKAFMVDESPNVSRTVSKLAQMGLVRKVRSSQDQRTVQVSITEAGKHAHEEGDAGLTDLSTNLSAPELKQLFDLLVKI
ncbi:MAG: DNA-binding MarR family transcriptional regulator [Myxococcota bacterium]